MDPAESREPRRFVVVGGGIGGQTLCETLRERDPGVQITLICGETHLPYDRVNLSELLAEEAPDGPLGTLQLRPEEWYTDNSIEVRLESWVESVDTDARTVRLAGGDTIDYDGLALATGSNPLVPPIEGAELAGVHTYRGPEDCEAIRTAAAGADRAAVIGGGLLGLEAARGIQAQACPVTVVHLMDRLMERQLDDGSAEMLLPAMQELGMEVELERQTEAIVGNGRAAGLRFDGGDELAADLVVISVGITPEVSLADAAGIETARGIVVDDCMRTSASAVVALGECAEHEGVVYGLVAPIYEQARVAANTLLELEGPKYQGSTPWAKLKVAEIDLVSIGEVNGDSGAASADAVARHYRKLSLRDGKMAGAILLGNTRGTEALLEAVRSSEEVADPLGRLVEAADSGPEDMPDTAQVCDCNGVLPWRTGTSSSAHRRTCSKEPWPLTSWRPRAGPPSPARAG